MAAPASTFFLEVGGGKWGQDIFQRDKTLKKSLVLTTSTSRGCDNQKVINFDHFVQENAHFFHDFIESCPIFP